MTITKEKTPIKISRKKTSNISKKSHKNLNLDKDDDDEKIINNEDYLVSELDEDDNKYIDIDKENVIDVQIIRYGKEFYLLSNKNLVYTVPVDFYFENEYLFYNKSKDYFRPEESNIYFFAGKKKKDKIIFDENFLKYKQRLKDYQKNNIELLHNNFQVNDRILYLLENKEGVVIDNSESNNNIKIMINNEIMTVDIKNIELIE